MTRRLPNRTDIKTLNLALQGGGAHGAYTWGVLDRLLADERLQIDGISGTSAGAINAAVLVSGFAKGGRDGARQALRNFWQRISGAAFFSPLQQSPWERALHGWNLDASPSYIGFDLLTRLFSPYDTNPLGLNPMRQILGELLDIDAINAHNAIKLFVAATSVRTGEARIFSNPDLTIDALLASTCLPMTYQAIMIDDEAYWDGGYSGNPALWPLIDHCPTHDVMLVQINPFVRDEVPKKAGEIIDRMNEISFNASLLAELRAIRFVSKLLQRGQVAAQDYKDLRLHLIFSPTELHDLNASSKMNANWDFFDYLFKIGFEAAEAWLAKNFDALGRHSTFAMEEAKYLHKKPARHAD